MLIVQGCFCCVNLFCFILLSVYVDNPVDKVVGFGFCCVSVCTHQITVQINLFNVLVVCGVKWRQVASSGELSVGPA